MVYYLSGNSIRIQATFKDMNGVLVEPTSSKLIVYDNAYKKLSEYTPLNKLSSGTYFYDYKTPTEQTDKTYFCEISGIVDGVEVLCRGTFGTRFFMKD
jgi:hypothetical protein